MIVLAVKPRHFEASFTLVEMLVVLTVIGILVAIVLPSAGSLLTAGSDAQAYNALAGQLAAARALAIQDRTLVGVHAQMSDPASPFARGPIACFTAVVRQKAPNDPSFVLDEGFSPQKMPGSIAFGRVDSPFWNSGISNYDPPWVTGTYQQPFTSLTFVFAPNGQLVSENVTFDITQPVFVNSPTNRGYLWNPNIANFVGILGLSPNPPSVKAAVMFDWEKFLAAADKPTYLNHYGQIIAVNLYTGAPLGR